jgi:hypothetical protein
VGSWGQLRAFTSFVLHSRQILLSDPQVTILNAGAKTGMATRLGAELQRYGIRVESVQNFGDDPRDEAGKREISMIVPRLEADAPLAAFFSSLLGIPASEPDSLLPAEKAGQVTIILGKDYAYEPLQFRLLPDDPSTPSLAPRALNGSASSLAPRSSKSEVGSFSSTSSSASLSSLSSSFSLPAPRSLGEGGSSLSSSSQ